MWTDRSTEVFETNAAPYNLAHALESAIDYQTRPCRRAPCSRPVVECFDRVKRSIFMIDQSARRRRNDMASQYGSVEPVQNVDVITPPVKPTKAAAPPETTANPTGPEPEGKRLAKQPNSGGASYLHYESGHARVRDASIRTVPLLNNIYIRTNFFIKQSQQYFPDHKLRTFAYFRGMQWCFLVIVIFSLLAPASSVYAFICLAVNALFTAIWTQHMIVVLFTMPLVLSQPVLKDNSSATLNKHFEYSVEECRADILAKDGEAVGSFGMVRGSGKLQAFKATSVASMKMCIAVSIMSFIACIIFLVYCTASGLILALKGNS